MYYLDIRKNRDIIMTVNFTGQTPAYVKVEMLPVCKKLMAIKQCTLIQMPRKRQKDLIKILVRGILFLIIKRKMCLVLKFIL